MMTNVPYGKLIADLIAKYPVRNGIWSYYPETNAFCIEDSTLRGNNGLDPWNRQMPASREVVYHGEGEDREIGSWTAITTIAGTHVELTIFND